MSTPREPRSGSAEPPDTGGSLVGVPSHPVAATVGALASAAAVGAAFGTAAGPVGIAIGAVIGAVAGGLGGDALAASVEQVNDVGHARETSAERVDGQHDDTFDAIGPAFAFGAEARTLHAGRTFDEVEPELARRWNDSELGPRLPWERARVTARDAWNRGPN